ncbi:MAG: bifunctional glutamate N-acetyltransferase/amino-acid acetyltransferase ArgJ [Bacillota bacterium]
MKRIAGGITAPAGFKATGVHCGLKKAGHPDLALIVSEPPAAGAGVFTTNQVKAAPVLLDMEHLRKQKGTAAVLINSGNANACTGETGMRNALASAQTVAEKLGLAPEEVLVASTGVIGVPLPLGKILKGIDAAIKSLAKENGGMAAAAIMTTDLTLKEAAVELAIEGKKVVIGGMAKGSGMIHPNMATMLAFVTSDAAVAKPVLQKAVESAVRKTFNCITVDGDTSTNDTLLVLANGCAGNETIDAVDSPAYRQFYAGLEEVCRILAKAMAADGEGATKLIEIRVEGALDDEDARLIGRTVAVSKLVKTAVFGEDANWGRILAAAGYSGCRTRVTDADIYLGDLQVCAAGGGIRFDEAKAKKILGRKEVVITIRLKPGAGSSVIWTCDLTYDYIKINASYRS